MRHIWVFLTILVTIALFSEAHPVNPQAEEEEEEQILVSTFDLERIQRSTVFIIQALDIGENLQITCVGTGTIISRDGLVLTNVHNTVQSADCPGTVLIISLSIRVNEPPIPKYRADIAQLDAGLDLALLRISRSIDGRLLEPNSLSLPFVELGDSNSVNLDETITTIGYPGIGNEPVSTVRGTITGFVSEPSGGTRAWMKTGASIPGTMSGGGTYNSAGQLIGIPTTAPVTSDSANKRCVTDTNRDGVVNASDYCIPLGNTINSLRPSNFARPLFRAASLGLQINAIHNFNPPTAPSAPATFRRLFFSPSVNDAGMPTTVLRSLPSGSNSLFLFFDYANMTPETTYSLRVTIDGIPNSTFSLAPVRWGGGTNGLWYLGSSTQPWPNGVYEFTLFANGIATETARLVIGGAPDNNPTFSDIKFGLLDFQGNVLGNGYVLPTGSIANAEFIFRNMVDGTPWTAIWYYEGNEVFRTPEGNVWSNGANGTATASITDPNGLLPGNYRVELYIENRLAATSDFIMAGAQEGVFPKIFIDPHFTSAASPEEARTSPAISNFASGTNAIFTAFDWSQLAPGTQWTMRWSIDGDVFLEQNQPWYGSQNGEKYLLQLTSLNGVPDGTYHLELLVGKILLARIEARVGIGQLPLDPFLQVGGVQLRGQVLDAETKQGIPGASVIIISDEYSVAQFAWRNDQIYSLSITDINGRFEIDRPLQLSILPDISVPYSAMVIAEGYLPLAADRVRVFPETDNPFDMTIYLTRD